ncbi:MAG: hypothetical protein AB8D78_06175 [Akkermansiaceae bacterium]
MKKHFSEPPEDSNEEALSSPDTGQRMKKFVYRGVVLDYCVDSHAIWFDQGEYSKLFAPEQKANQIKTATPTEPNSTIYNVLDGATSAVDIIDVSGDLIGTVGDFVGDLISGIDIF